VNVNKRLQTHYRELSNHEHHNESVQKAWGSNPKSFHHKILQVCPQNLTPLQKQIFLFEKELEFIYLSENTCANVIDGDLVFTADAKLEFENIIKYIKLRVKEVRSLEIYKKEKIGEVILDTGVMDRISMPRSGIEIKESNVLTWINKSRRYSNFDYMPTIRRENPFYEPLVKALKTQQKRVMEIDADKKLVDEFRDSLLKHKGKYDTCDLESLNEFQTIMKKYEKSVNVPGTIANFRKISIASYPFDSCLEGILEPSILRMLRNGIPQKLSGKTENSYVGKQGVKTESSEPSTLSKIKKWFER
jgi:hypothetical protein